jgi:hypothetical protein
VTGSAWQIRIVLAVWHTLVLASTAVYGRKSLDHKRVQRVARHDAPLYKKLLLLIVFDQSIVVSPQEMTSIVVYKVSSVSSSTETREGFHDVVVRRHGESVRSTRTVAFCFRGMFAVCCLLTEVDRPEWF